MLIIELLATMRIARLITEDKITEPLRDYVEGHFPDSRASYLITCFMCTSVYAAAAVTAGSSSRLRKGIRALALSEAAILLRQHGG